MLILARKGQAIASTPHARVPMIAPEPNYFKCLLTSAVLTRSLLLLLLTVLAAPAWAQSALPASVSQALAAAKIPPGNAAVLVQEAGGHHEILRSNTAAPMNPASVMKLVTTYAALELLGPAYRWRTEAHLDGDNLILKGYGDPKLNYESFWMLLRNLRGRGLREIRGDVILDRSRFASVA